VVSKLSDHAIEAVDSPKMQDLLAHLGTQPNPMAPTQFVGWLAGERTRWHVLIEDTGLAHQ
jgi:tripartite-type tricarboxylate transporter receptor subunit TctC